MRYHIEIDRDTNYVKLQDRANLYLEERAHLGITLHDWRLQWLEGQYHLTIVLSVPIEKDTP